MFLYRIDASSRNCTLGVASSEKTESVTRSFKPEQLKHYMYRV